MAIEKKHMENYQGFEQGPIRPPSEAGSLLLRLTRNCPWNRCTFCPVYKGEKFSLRPMEHVLEDITTVSRHVHRLRNMESRRELSRLIDETDEYEMEAMHSAIHWMQNGMKSIFLQDANSLIMKPENLITILRYISECFPWAERITSYARSHSVARISDDHLKTMCDAGLTRIHIGMESASDKVLERIKKGSSKAMHITAGLKAKKAGMELSEYVMPGLGGVELSQDHALETADALNQINPDFIRLRSLAVPDGVELQDDYNAGRFIKASDLDVAREILLFLETLDGISSQIKSDHVLNLFQDVEGTYPNDKQRMTQIIRDFLDIEPLKRMHIQIGRRMGMIRHIEDHDDAQKINHIKDLCRVHGVTPKNVDLTIDEIMKRFF